MTISLKRIDYNREYEQFDWIHEMINWILNATMRQFNHAIMLDGTVITDNHIIH